MGHPIGRDGKEARIGKNGLGRGVASRVALKNGIRIADEEAFDFREAVEEGIEEARGAPLFLREGNEAFLGFPDKIRETNLLLAAGIVIEEEDFPDVTEEIDDPFPADLGQGLAFVLLVQLEGQLNVSVHIVPRYLDNGQPRRGG